MTRGISRLYCLSNIEVDFMLGGIKSSQLYLYSTFKRTTQLTQSAQQTNKNNDNSTTKIIIYHGNIREEKGKKYGRLKAWEKRKVFKLDLKRSMLGEDLIYKGKAFQSLGATTEKALSPLILRHVLGIQRRFCFEDLSDLGALYRIYMSPINLGAKPLRTLKTKNKI